MRFVLLYFTILLTKKHIWSISSVHEQKITEINAKNNMLETRLEDANKLLQFYMAREKSLVDGKFFKDVINVCER